jgi:mRNA-degrading endonuclease toxin of MazEF toxin-antitoxin module
MDKADDARQSLSSLKGPSTAFPLTSQLDALRFPGTVLVEADSQNGLRRASVALVFQLTALDQRYLKDPLGKITTKVMNEIWMAFDELVGRT